MMKQREAKVVHVWFRCGPEINKVNIRLRVGPEGFWPFVFECIKVMVLAVAAIVGFWLLAILALGFLCALAK